MLRDDVYPKYHIYNIRCISVIMLAVILGNEPKYDKTK